MNALRKRLTYANVISSLALFLILAGGSALAANQLGKNSVGTKQLKKNAITAAKIKKGAVTGAKVKNGSLTGSAFKAGSISGAQINAATLGTVPSATKAASADSASSAGTASNLAGHTVVDQRLNFGEVKTLASNGSVSYQAHCIREGGDEIVISAKTSVNGAVSAGNDDWEGGAEPEDFLNTDTPFEESELVSNDSNEGEVNVENERDEGFVLGPDGKGLTTNSEGIALGLNYGGPGCLVAGIFDAVG